MKAFLIVESNADELATDYKVIGLFHRKPNALSALVELADDEGLSESSSTHYVGKDKQVKLIEVEYNDDILH